MSRLSPGTAISAMQVNEAVRMGTLVLWKKNLPEDFKTAGALLVSDRGGFIYEPKVGMHERVSEVDFASLYPSIMVVHNISPETLQCACCPDSRRIVPEHRLPHLREAGGPAADGAGARSSSAAWR